MFPNANYCFLVVDMARRVSSNMLSTVTLNLEIRRIFDYGIYM